jgi:hypothetical protein
MNDGREHKRRLYHHSRLLCYLSKLLKNNETSTPDHQRGMMRPHLFPPLLLVLSLLLFQCSPTNSLSDTEKAKLDPVLARLFAGEQVDKSLVGEVIHPDGKNEYTVIVRSDQPEKVKELGVVVSSVFGDVMVVHATLDDLRKIVSLPSVRTIEAGAKKTLQRMK